ncbi:bifunctional glutamate N-acetyltransferase/amino-acid acetyltransferase ArgJ [Endozoicomonas gorgoniicola]|uniref:Arginine biosynthesis bifunctional protein ArgJ n=1 Tax=Endozoicomonas gorgoniicola TaxID=1234144 RepID=A0ABT3MW15_9GAMM|nr:bifunctional glutamate N-acetyltransferase/amino-acid acetyltransferase ArgJ [Endozoicomonas gorgoniicola]MCW7553564.1 bifunctional glutamate N-acetyltransferase/amino-acid acetyltransferase ArgJ [Endozoicomonas gorgoniicola]
MAVGSGNWPEVKAVKGFRLGTAEAGIRKINRRDLVVMEWDEGASVAGVFTQNKFCAAPVLLAKARLNQNPRCFVINTGNANAGTGQQGMQAAKQSAAGVAELLNIPPESVLPFSTGVIGEQLPVDRLLAGLPAVIADLSEEGWLKAGEGILTTDTRPKGACRQFEVDGVVYTVSGISKGSGMIRPNMATMLAFIATDAAVEQPLLQKLLNDAVNLSFNRISVDGDTSTNDCCMLVATGKTGSEPLNSEASDLYVGLRQAVNEVAIELAQAIVRDGEGASKFITVSVEQADTVADALEVAYTIAHSPLVKTALFASDPNWGRILAAAGRAEVDSLVIERIAIWLDDVCIVENGEPAASYTEAAGQAVMDQEEITIRISLGSGDITEQIWTTDLSHEYVRINAEYRS